MSALASARRHHHRADIYLAAGRAAEATNAVRAVLAIEFPAGAPEAEDVRLDARSRLADLLILQGRTDAALEVVAQGLQSATRNSFFLSNLYATKANVHEALMRTTKGTEREREMELAIEALNHAAAIELRRQAEMRGAK